VLRGTVTTLRRPPSLRAARGGCVLETVLRAREAAGSPWRANAARGDGGVLLTGGARGVVTPADIGRSSGDAVLGALRSVGRRRVVAALVATPMIGARGGPLVAAFAPLATRREDTAHRRRPRRDPVAEHSPAPPPILSAATRPAGAAAPTTIGEAPQLVHHGTRARPRPSDARRPCLSRPPREARRGRRVWPASRKCTYSQPRAYSNIPAGAEPWSAERWPRTAAPRGARHQGEPPEACYLPLPLRQAQGERRAKAPAAGRYGFRHTTRFT
jgi:hypothetical protein